MSIKRLCRAFVLGFVLLGGSMIGIPMRPEEIEELMYTMSRTNIEVSLEESESSDDTIGDPLRQRQD